MGDVVLGELLRERGLMPGEAASIDVFLAGVTAEDLPHVLALAHEVREAGLRAEYALSVRRWGSSSSWPTPAGPGSPWSSAPTTGHGAR
jgi:hypothetical protein